MEVLHMTTKEYRVETCRFYVGSNYLEEEIAEILNGWASQGWRVNSTLPYPDWDSIVFVLERDIEKSLSSLDKPFTPEF